MEEASGWRKEDLWLRGPLFLHLASLSFDIWAHKILISERDLFISYHLLVGAFVIREGDKSSFGILKNGVK